MLSTLSLRALIASPSVDAKANYRILVVCMFSFVCLTFGLYALLGSPGLISPASDGKQYFVKLATQQLATQHYQDAADNYSKALKQGVTTAPLLVGYVLAQAAAKTDFYISEENMVLLKQAASLAPNDIYPVVYLALALHQRRKNKEAVAILQQFLTSAQLTQAEKAKIKAFIMQYKIG